MSEVEAIEYWSVMAQLIPIVALALVIEIRTLTPKVDERFPRLGRWWMGSWLGLTFGALTASMFAALAMIGRDPNFDLGEGWQFVARMSVLNAFIYLVVDALVPLLARAFAEFIAPLLALHPRLRFRMWKKDRTIRRLTKQLDGLMIEGWRAAREVGAQVEKTAKQIDQVRALGPIQPGSETAGYIAEAEAWLDPARRYVQRTESRVDAEIITLSDRRDLDAVRQELQLPRMEWRRQVERERKALLSSP